MKRLLAISGLLLYTACSGALSHNTPPGQPPLRDLQPDVFRNEFNSAHGIRVVLLLSPT